MRVFTDLDSVVAYVFVADHVGQNRRAGVDLGVVDEQFYEWISNKNHGQKLAFQIPLLQQAGSQPLHDLRDLKQ